MFIQQLVIYGLVGLIMDYAGYGWDTSIYWCMITLLIASNYLARKDGHAQGLEDANDVLAVANRMLDQARAHVEQHTKTLEAERTAIQATLDNTKDTL